ncbi:expressed unknown protein [Seminavis robusta]|uniref:Uncharacterized protein n=1 Tax=Seminavis robusta TaxID=568900 RepID=A0A9N8HD91_9STRA|nr:expressed unknown protein [Seminavis robusta]|eukprot:Sro351_g123820.1 n/a (249) ;mRNA; r:7459-8205
MMQSLHSLLVVVQEEMSSTVLAAFTSHLIVVFYNRKFQWHQFLALKVDDKVSIYADTDAAVKFSLCSLLLCICFRGDSITAEIGAMLCVVLSVPQLKRGKGQWNQKVRVVLGPLTPILAVNGLVSEPLSVGTWSLAIVSFLAFVLLRPDNDQVLDLMHDCSLLPLWIYDILKPCANRRRWHGRLAACNALVALCQGVIVPSILRVFRSLPNDCDEVYFTDNMTAPCQMAQTNAWGLFRLKPALRNFED